MFDTTKRCLFQIEDMETEINFVNRTSYTQVRRNATHIFGHKIKGHKMASAGTAKGYQIQKGFLGLRQTNKECSATRKHCSHSIRFSRVLYS